MTTMNRRRFLLGSAAALGAMAAADAPAVAESVSRPLSVGTPVTLGGTGIRGGLVGLGTGVKSWNGQSELTRKGKRAYMEMIEYAWDRGIRYFDMADMYGSHDYVREALRKTGGRDEAMLLTKAVSRDPTLLRADLERFRHELDTDCLDVVLIHCITDQDGADWTHQLSGCMSVLEEAKERGILRAHGVSCHSLEALRIATQHPWVDVILARINPFGVKMDGPVEAVVPLLEAAHASGKGVIGMKIVGEGELSDRIPESLRFALGLASLSAMAVGFTSPDQIDQMEQLLQSMGTVDTASGRRNVRPA